MKVNTNLWNKLRYTFYAPVYDHVARHFEESRRQSIDSLNIQSGERVLIVGGGTGLDFEYIPSGCSVVATDITPAMVERMKSRSNDYAFQSEIVVMDGQKLTFDDESFDKIILHLILAVIPNAELTLLEAERVLKPGGEIAVFDKLIGKGGNKSLTRRLLNPLTNLLFSDITRNMYEISAATNLAVVSENEANMSGFFKRFKLRKNK